MGRIIRIGDSNESLVHLGTYDNYSSMVALNPSITTVGALAFCINSEGTSWLPYNLGGTYYPKGTYIYNGVSWISSADQIAAQLDELT